MKKRMSLTKVTQHGKQWWKKLQTFVFQKVVPRKYSTKAKTPPCMKSKVKFADQHDHLSKQRNYSVNPDCIRLNEPKASDKKHRKTISLDEFSAVQLRKKDFMLPETMEEETVPVQDGREKKRRCGKLQEPTARKEEANSFKYSLKKIRKFSRHAGGQPSSLFKRKLLKIADNIK